MLLGKMLRGLTGTPMRRMALANSSFAEAEPEPLTLANLMTKSLTASICLMEQPPCCALRCEPPSERPGGGSCSHPPLGACLRPCRRHLEQEFLHVPGPRRAALGAQAAVQADVFVLDHHPAGLETFGDVERLVGVSGRGAQA